MRTIAIIPARGGSKGLPGKNLLPIGGRPLMGWSIEHALEVAGISTVLVSTDSEEIAAVARTYGAQAPFLRPSELASDVAATEPVLLHALDWYAARGEEFDAVVLLQPTSPVRRAGTLSAALEAFTQSGADSLLGVCSDHHFYWRNLQAPSALYDFHRRPRRQDIPDDERWFRENGSIYISKTAGLRSTGNRLFGKIIMHVMTEEEGVEIDSRADFAVAAALMQFVRS